MLRICAHHNEFHWPLQSFRYSPIINKYEEINRSVLPSFVGNSVNFTKNGIEVVS
jgi:hypothetical protein